MTNNKIGIFIIIVIALLVMTIVAGHFALENDKLAQELKTNSSLLSSTNAELETVQENLQNKTEQFDKINQELIDVTKELEESKTIIETLKSEEYIVGMTVTNEEIDMLAKTVWGEARGCNTMEQSAVVWCILNRVDAWHNTIAETITAPEQFKGYNSTYPVTDAIKALVEDVVARWKLEKICNGEVGRTLPSNYLYFVADETRIGNVFRTKWSGDYEVWDWNCWNPYK